MTSPLSRVGAQTGFLTAPVPDTNFDTDPAFAQRQYTFRFDLVEAKTGATVRTLTPLLDTVPTLSHDTTRTIKRQLQLELDVADTAVVDTIKHRVRVKMVLPSGTTYPLGRYMFTDNTRTLYTSGTRSSPQLMDEMFIVDNARESAFPVRYPRVTTNAFADSNFNASQNNVALLLVDLLTDFTTFDFRIEDTAYITNNTWSFGTSNAQVLSDLALFGDYFDPWFGNDEQLHLIRSFDPADRVADIDWDCYFHVYADTVTDADDLLTAANRFIVVSNNPSAGNQPLTNQGPTSNVPIVGRYDVPTTAPHSIYNRGFVVPDIRQLQIDTPAQAQAMATNIGITNTVFERQTMDTWVDPRHDSYTVIRWQDANWLELSWSMSLVAGGTMSHTIRKVYG